MLNGFISALKFLTVIPLPFAKDAAFVPKDAVRFFPLTGVIIGLIVAILDLLFGWCFNRVIASALDVAVLACLSGALHLDGLGDSADGLFSHKPAKKALDIMRDSRVGSMGLVTVVLVLLIKFAALTGVNEHRFALLVLAPAFARTGMVFAMLHLPYLRKEDGLAGPFFVSSMPGLFFISFIILLVAAGLTGLPGILIILGFIVSTVLLPVFFKKRMGGVTGDMLGAMAETQETLFLLLAAVSLG